MFDANGRSLWTKGRKPGVKAGVRFRKFDINAKEWLRNKLYGPAAPSARFVQILARRRDGKVDFGECMWLSLDRWLDCCCAIRSTFHNVGRSAADVFGYLNTSLSRERLV
jgi:hypothetical protein